MIRRALVALMAVSLLAACSSGGDESRPTDTRPSGGGAVLVAPQNDRVLVIGDSNLFASSEQVDAELVSFRHTVRGVPGLGLKDLDPYWLGELPGLLADDPDVVVVALGTNDATTQADVDAFSSRLDTMMAALGDRPVVWVTHVDPRPAEVPGGAAAVNAAIREAAARWPNLTVLDRTPVLAADPSLVRDDGLHFTDAGKEAFAVAIRDAAWDAIGAQTRLGPLKD